MFSGLKHILGWDNQGDTTPVIFGAPPQVHTALKSFLNNDHLVFFDYHHIVKRNIDQTIKKLRQISPSAFYIWQDNTTQLLLEYANRKRIPVRHIHPGCLELLTNAYPDYTSLTVWEDHTQLSNSTSSCDDLAPFIHEVRRRFKSTQEYILLLGSTNLDKLISTAKSEHPETPLVYLPDFFASIQLSEIELCQRQNVALFDFKNEIGPLDAFLKAKEVYTSQSIYALLLILLGLKTTNIDGPTYDSTDLDGLSAALQYAWYYDFTAGKAISATEALKRTLKHEGAPLHSGIPTPPKRTCPVIYLYTSSLKLLDELKASFPYFDLRKLAPRHLQDPSSIVLKRLKASSNYGLIISEHDSLEPLQELLQNTKNKPYILHYGPFAGVGSPYFLKVLPPYSLILQPGGDLNESRLQLIERTQLNPHSPSFKRAQSLITLITKNTLSQFTPTAPCVPLKDPTVLVLAKAPHLESIFNIAQNENPNATVLKEDQLDVQPGALLGNLSALYTDDHFLGLEALIKGVKVVTFGKPFYGGWGLTDDRYGKLYHGQKRTLEDLVYAIYIKQPTYMLGLTPETILDRIQQDIKEFDGLESYTSAKDAFASAHYERGISLFQSVLEKYPKAAWLNDFGSELLEIKRVLEAIPPFEKAHTLEPQNAKYAMDLAFALQLSGDFSQSTAALFKKAIELADENLSLYIDKSIRFMWEKEGISKNLLDLCAIYYRKLTEPSSAFLNTYAAILHQSGNTPLALTLYQPDGLNGNHLALRAACKDPKDIVAQKVVAHAAQYAHTFERLIRENAHSFCVIGNSPCELGSGNGPLIDQKKLVIRLNNFSIDYPFAADYGRKTDIWVRNGIASSEVTNREIPHLQHTLFTGNNYPHRCRSWSNLYEYVQAGTPFEFLPDKVYTELIQKLESLPSTGLKVCYWIYKLLGPLPRDSVFGFSFVDQMKDATKTHYFDHAAPSIRHRWDRELELFESLLVPQDVNLIHLSQRTHG